MVRDAGGRGLMSELLLELYVEEIPALMQEKARQSYHSIFERKLKEQDIEDFTLETHIGPRRFALFAKNLPDKIKSKKIEVKGPKTSAPKQAVEGFCKSNNIDVSDLVVKEVKGQECYFYENETGERSIDSLLPAIIQETISEYIWPKSMFWNNYKIKFVRPLLNILCVLDDKVLDFTYGHLKANNHTFGHRFAKYKKIEVKNIDDYKKSLENNHVTLAREDRKNQIRQGIEDLESKHNFKVELDERLLEEVAGLNENVRVLAGKISEKFMHLPPEILSTSMKSHQRFFSCRDSNGDFAPYFVFVSNVVDADSKEIIFGNEKVLSARLADGLYFYNQDRKKSLEERIDALDKLVFHEKLGSMKDKVHRLKKMAEFIAPENKELHKAALLCKSDLATEIVGEFPELQGLMGYYYSLEENLGQNLASYIGNHYKPVGVKDLPEKGFSELALIDKIDSLVGLMLAGERASGSKDPYGLRRYALGIVRIMLDGVEINLRKLVEYSSNLFNIKDKSGIDNVLDFIQERLKNYWKDEYSQDVINSVVDFAVEDNMVLIYKKLQALGDFVSREDAKELLSIHRRISNIIVDFSSQEFSSSLFDTKEEKALEKSYLEISPEIEKSIEDRDFTDVFEKLLSFKKPLSDFFENILVNDENIEKSNNRKALLKSIDNLFNRIANFSQLNKI